MKILVTRSADDDEALTKMKFVMMKIVMTKMLLMMMVI
jgi:hypothetical protein